jgi:hypothetical protein
VRTHANGDVSALTYPLKHTQQLKRLIFLTLTRKGACDLKCKQCGFTAWHEKEFFHLISLSTISEKWDVTISYTPIYPFSVMQGNERNISTSRTMKPDNENNSFDVYPATPAVPEEFLNDAVMCGLLGFGFNSSNLHVCSAEVPDENQLPFQSVGQNTGPNIRASLPPLRSGADVNASGQVFSPTSCIASPISDDFPSLNSKKEAHQSNGGSEYVFGVGNPAIVNTPGVYAPSKLEPLRSIHKPHFSSGSVHNANSGRGSNAAGSQSFAQRCFGDPANKENIDMEQFLFPPMAGPVYGAPSNLLEPEALQPDLSVLSGHFLRDPNFQARIVSGALAQKGQATSALQDENDPKYGHVFVNPIRCFAGDTSFQFPGLEPRPYRNDDDESIPGPQYGQGVADPASTLSFLDMFRIEAIPIPQPSDWKSPPLLSKGPQSTGGVVGHHIQKSDKRKKTPRARARKPTSSKRKQSGTNFALNQNKASRPTKSGGISMDGVRHGAAVTGTNKVRDASATADVILPNVDGVSVNAVQPSRFCHICLRRAGRVSLLACGNALEGSCRKVVCEKCFETFEWNWNAALQPNSMWTCTHCRQAFVPTQPEYRLSMARSSVRKLTRNWLLLCFVVHAVGVRNALNATYTRGPTTGDTKLWLHAAVQRKNLMAQVGCGCDPSFVDRSKKMFQSLLPSCGQ